MHRKFTTEEFIQKAREVHGDKYDYSKVDYIDSRHNVTIICPKHGEFKQKANRHLRGSGCRKCADEQRAISQKFTTEEFIQKAREVHGDKYDYSKVDYINSRHKVTITCPKHGEFTVLPYAHIKLKEGCPKCAGRNLTTEEWIQKAREVHGDKYDYSKVDYKGVFEKVCIICPKHGEFWQRPDSHLSGCGCMKCVSNTKKTKYALLVEEFIEKARQIHGDKYDYSKVEYVNNRTKVCIICPIHGEFWQTPGGHLYNLQGCPYCQKSKMEDYTQLILEREKINFEVEKTFDWLKYDNNMRLDFVCGNVAIECQGGQHFVPIAKYGGIEKLNLILDRDRTKYNLCKENNINIIYIIPYRYKNTEIFKEFYINKNYIFFKELNDKLTDKIKTFQ